MSATTFSALLVKPGITGEWQVNGRSKVEDFEEIVQLDVEYQRKWSTGYDLALIWQNCTSCLQKRRRVLRPSQLPKC